VLDVNPSQMTRERSEPAATLQPSLPSPPSIVFSPLIITQPNTTKRFTPYDDYGRHMFVLSIDFDAIVSVFLLKIEGTSWLCQRLTGHSGLQLGLVSYDVGDTSSFSQARN
jgi:hypothetical protein